MNICLIGNGLTNLLLAKVLVDKNIDVSLFYRGEKKEDLSTRTLGITRDNFFFLSKYLKNIKKISWPIYNIKIFNEKNLEKKLIKFESKKYQLFSILKNKYLLKLIKNELKNKKKFKIVKILNSSFYEKILKDDKFDLIINSDSKCKISENLFKKKIVKNYDSTAFTSKIIHKKVKNNTATQIFTKFGPLAFLPCSNSETSIVFSVINKKSKKNINQIKKIICSYNTKYKINNFSNFQKFNLNFKILKKYYIKKILFFGDNLHKIHPLAGQGFNMNIRDIKVISKLIDERIDLGLPVDESILEKFENQTKHLNYLFSSSIDFIHEYFNFENKYGNRFSNNLLKLLDKNYLFKKYVNKFADQGLVI